MSFEIGGYSYNVIINKIVYQSRAFSIHRHTRKACAMGCKGFSSFPVTTRRDGKEPQRSGARRSPTSRLPPAGGGAQKMK